MQTQIKITGYLVGHIWMPSFDPCWKDLDYDVTAKSWNWGEKGTIRDHVLAATNDGDFQSCSIAQGEVVVTRINGSRRTSRSFPLSMFKSVADCLYDDSDWFPSSPDDDEDFDA